MKQYDYLIVGAGLFGAVFAQQATKAGKSCLVIDKRDHIAGNIYTENVEGINVHRYGAHIFHTNNKEVWDYVNQFAVFNRYTNSPVANYKGELYNLPFNMNTFNKMWGVVTPAEAEAKIEEQRAAHFTAEPKNLEEQAINLVVNLEQWNDQVFYDRLGTNEEFEVLCREAAKYGIGIVLDGVFSHTGSDSRYFNREGRYGDGGAYRDPNSPYRSWYDFDPKYKGGYRSWWGFETLPEVNEENPSYVEFITGEGGVIDTWLRRGAAGFRLDVADELPDDFIEKIRAAVKRVSPEKFLLGEVWEDATTKYGFGQRRTYLLGKGLDSVMNYPFKNAVLDFVKGKPAEQAIGEILSICEHYPAPAMDTALNFLSTHDTERALTVIADEPANGRGREWQSGRCVVGEAYEEGMLRLRMAYAIIYTLPGVPCLYYGDEIGMQGYRDPFNRAFFCWDSHEKRLKPVLAQLAQLRHTCEAFRTGELRVLRAQDGILHYQRVGEAETAEVIVNRSEHIIVEPLASGKHTEVNPMGFTIVVEENGHNPNHSYYDIK